MTDDELNTRVNRMREELVAKHRAASAKIMATARAEQQMLQAECAAYNKRVGELIIATSADVARSVPGARLHVFDEYKAASTIKGEVYLVPGIALRPFKAVTNMAKVKFGDYPAEKQNAVTRALTVPRTR
jgi:hypothetical protein